VEPFEAVATVLAVRRYKQMPVPDETVNRIVEAGRLTGSSMNAQPWYFIVVRDPATLRELAGRARSGPYIAEAPLAIAVAVDRTRYAVSDASRAIQSMVLTAWGEGIGSNWVGFGGLEEAARILGVPDDKDLLAIVTFGYPAQPVGKGRKKRKALSEVAYLERFGNPLR
jgi:nitroreductase